MRRKWREWAYRIQIGDKKARAQAYGVLFGGLLSLAEWAGWRGKFYPWGDPRPVAEIWWHFPIWVGVIWALWRLLSTER